MSITESERQERLESLRNKRDEDIDTSDIPEITDWSGAVRGRLYRPVKQQVSLRIDADILEWFKERHPKYQTALNEALRQHINNAG